ncbi:MAG TPA: hypothetical protein VK150_00505 [Geothrix sp.]|nr:hypothetical protein [Geothrix sp.]
MKILKHLESGQEITVHDVDARDLLKTGEYESLGEAPGFKATKEAAADALKVQVKVDGRPFSVEIKEALEALEGMKAELAARDARIAQLEAALAGNHVDLDAMKAGELIDYAAKNGLDIGGLVPQSGQAKILAAVKESLAKKEAQP